MPRRDTLPAAQALALLRVVAGVLLIVGAAETMKFYALAGFLPVPVTALSWQLELPMRLSAWLATHQSGLLGAFVRDLLLPNGALVAGLLTWVEVATGVLLVLGLRTRLAAALAGLVSGALVLAAGGVASPGGRTYLLLIMVLLTCVIGNAGQVGGMDGWRRQRSRDRNL